MAEYARNFFIAVFLGCLLLGLFIVGTSTTNAEEITETAATLSETSEEKVSFLLGDN
ncbi:hypothetical protein [Alkalihalobacterium elongatum]|uniref:hypothetical protein n=1 Tax=Alkalihalobacterium elongatum TaxID=2675466 RepID=UPI001C1FF0AC|nr:hypothetical protein [Alkalihalobacterium elongatum]